jgi:hypothetical protein
MTIAAKDKHEAELVNASSVTIASLGLLVALESSDTLAS